MILDEEFRVKRHRKSTEKKQSKQKILHKSSISRTNSQTKKKIVRSIVKITGGSSGYKSLSNHIDYISRNGSIDLISSDGSVFKNMEKQQAKREMSAVNENLLPQNDFNKCKQTYNIVFSMPVSKRKKQKLIDAVYETLKEQFEDNYFLIALHEDKDHPHVHVSLNKKSMKNGENIHLNKEILQNIKYLFSKKLIEKGLDVKLENKHCLKRKTVVVYEKIKPTGVFELLEYGKAPYEFNENKRDSFYVTYLSSKGKKITLWGLDLERALAESGAKVGDDIKLTKQKTEEESQKKSKQNWEINVYQTREQRKKKEIEKFTQQILER